MASGPTTSQTTWAHIHTRSPFYVSFTTNVISATMELKIWVGNRVTGYPSTPQYTLTKRSESNQVVFEIAELIKDYISQTTTLSSGTIWVQTEITDGITTDTVDYVADEGYLLYNEAIQTDSNVDDSSLILLPGAAGEKRIMVTDGGNAIIPWRPENTNTTDWYYSKYDLNGNGLGTTYATFNAMANSRHQYATVTDNVGRVRFTNDGVNEDVYVDELRCSKYDTIELLYVNKYGAKAYFPFILKHVETVEIQSSNYKASTMNYGTLSSVQGLHVNNKQIGEVMQRFTLNTDWIDEYYVQQLEELMLSETVWMRKDGVLQPVNVTTNSLEKKKHVNDKLINYTLDVELARNYINTLR